MPNKSNPFAPIGYTSASGAKRCYSNLRDLGNLLPDYEMDILSRCLEELHGFRHHKSVHARLSQEYLHLKLTTMYIINYVKTLAAPFMGLVFSVALSSANASAIDANVTVLPPARGIGTNIGVLPYWESCGSISLDLSGAYKEVVSASMGRLFSSVDIVDGAAQPSSIPGWVLQLTFSEIKHMGDGTMANMATFEYSSALALYYNGVTIYSKRGSYRDRPQRKAAGAWGCSGLIENQQFSYSDALRTGLSKLLSDALNDTRFQSAVQSAMSSAKTNREVDSRTNSESTRNASSQQCVRHESWYSREESRIWVGVANNCPDVVDINVCINVRGKTPVSEERNSKRVRPGETWKFSIVEFQGRPFAHGIRWCQPGKSTNSALCPADCPSP